MYSSIEKLTVANGNRTKRMVLLPLHWKHKKINFAVPFLMQRKIIMSSALTAASMFAGDSSFGLDSIEMMLRTILST